MSDLFTKNTKKQKSREPSTEKLTSPLADRIRPQKLYEIVGQEHILGSNKILQQSIVNDQLFSMIYHIFPN